MNTSQAWLELIAADLRNFSTDLLEQGLTSGNGAAKSVLLGSPLQQTLKLVEQVCIQVPHLLNDLETEEHRNVAEMVPAMLPRHAVLSNRPSDYAYLEGRTIPYRWLKPELEQSLPVAPLRWILFVIQQTNAQLLVHGARFEKQIETARLSRDGESDYAAIDRHQLERMLSEVKSAELKIRLANGIVMRRAGGKLSPNRQRPTPFPRSSTWQAFRRIAEHLLRPVDNLGAWLRDLLSAPIHLADGPFLYQRWCGLQLIRSIQRLGWDVAGDVTGALFLGGPIAFRMNEKSIILWVEPRISLQTAELTGWMCVNSREELTPDFLLVCDRHGQQDAFVLDATLSTGTEIMLAKGKYRDRLQGKDSMIIAGIPIPRRPLRSWALAPIHSPHCRLGDHHGWTGIIPLRAETPDRSALDAWVTDVLNHATS